MSTTLTVTSMVSEIQTRVPIGLTQQFCVDRLNIAFRWIEQRGSFTWMLRRASISVAASTWNMPADCDVGRPMYFSPDTASLGPPVMFLPYEKFLLQADFQSTIPVGFFSAWSFYWNGAQYVGVVLPTQTGGAVTCSFYYHRQTPAPLAFGANFFPTPDCFDDLIVDLSVAQAMEVYNLSNWEMFQKRAEDSVMRLMDQYRSTKENIVGLTEQAKETQEADLRRNE